jgi:hypothetical protein
MRHLGFGKIWRDIIRGLLGSSSTRILMNGIPGEVNFAPARIRAGRPTISRMLFIIVLDVLWYYNSCPREPYKTTSPSTQSKRGGMRSWVREGELNWQYLVEHECEAAMPILGFDLMGHRFRDVHAVLVVVDLEARGRCHQTRCGGSHTRRNSSFWLMVLCSHDSNHWHM